MASKAGPVIRIVTPGTRRANNGNWRTAERWSKMLRTRFRVVVQSTWDGEPADALIALHARRSAAAVQRFRAAHPDRPLAVVLTGTDLYRDLPESVEAQRSLSLADRLVVLQPEAKKMLDAGLRRKCSVIFQSAERLRPRPKPAGELCCVAVGHLRDEKDPRTLFRAMERLPADAPIQVLHIGAALDDTLGKEARSLGKRDARYRFVGALPHGRARSAMQRAHVLVHPSRLEGGANVIVEAVTAGTAVIASRIAGNIGMLGSRYPGYFEVGDADGLASLMLRACEERAYLDRLSRACATRSALFEPREEQRALVQLVRKLLA